MADVNDRNYERDLVADGDPKSPVRYWRDALDPRFVYRSRRKGASDTAIEISRAQYLEQKQTNYYARVHAVLCYVQPVTLDKLKAEAKSRGMRPQDRAAEILNAFYRHR